MWSREHTGWPVAVTRPTWERSTAERLRPILPHATALASNADGADAYRLKRPEAQHPWRLHPRQIGCRAAHRACQRSQAKVTAPHPRWTLPPCAWPTHGARLARLSHDSPRVCERKVVGLSL